MILRLPIQLVEDCLVAVKTLRKLDEEAPIRVTEVDQDTDWAEVEERLEKHIAKIPSMPGGET